MSTKKFGIVAGIAIALSVVISPAFAACSLTTLSECDSNGLMALIVQLLGSSTTTTTTTTTTGTSISGIPAGFTFTTNLKQGSTGNDVKYLQVLLNSDTATSVGNKGSETSYFGSMTKAAVVKFQNKYAAETLTPYGLTAGTGFFGSTSRAKANALIATGVGTGTGTTTLPAGCTSTTGYSSTTGQPCSGSIVVTGLNVALAANTPGATSMAKGAVATAVASYNISSQTATTLDSIKFTRSGLGLNSDYSNVYIYSNGSRLKSGRAISSDSSTVEFTNIGLAIPANTLVNLTVAVDVSASATTGDVNTMGIASAADVKFVGGTTPASVFPINGNAMTISSITIGTATIAAGSVPTSPTIGATGALIGEMKITAGSDDVTLNKVTFTQNGTISSSLLKNITLKMESTILATTASMTGDTVTLTLTTPYTVGKNANKTFSIYADINGGKTSDTIRFYIDETSDVTVIDAKYNQGANVTNSFGSTQASYVGALQGGEITITDKGPAANTIARNKTDVELLRFGINTSRNVTVKDYNLTLDDGTNKANTTVNGDTDTFVIGTTTGVLSVTSASGFEVDDYIMVGTTTYDPTTDMIAKITAINTNDLTITPVQGTNLTVANADIVTTVEKITAVRLVNVDTGSTIYSSTTARYFYNGAAAVNIAASDDFDMNIGTAYTFAIRADISEYSAPDMELLAGFELNTASDVKDYDANEYVLAANIVPSTITGKTMTIGASSLTVTRASTPVSTAKVKGTQDVELFGMSVNAGSTGDVKVSQVVVRLFADANNSFTAGVGDVQPNTVVGSVSLYDESGKIAGPVSLANASWVSNTSGYYKATFSNLTYTIPSGASKKLTVKVNLLNTLTTEAYLAANIAPSTDITVKDADGNTMTLADDTSNGGLNEDDSSATIGNDVTPVVVIDVKTSGTLALKAEGSPSAAIVAAGSTNVVMSKYKLTATNEAFILDKLSIASDTSTTDFATAEADNDNDITQVGIRVNGGTPVKANLSAGVANFSNLNVTVPADGYVYIEVLADFNTIAGGATSGETPRLGIYQLQNANNTFRAVGQGSSTTATYTTTLATTVTGEENIYAMTARKTMPTITKSSTIGSTATLLNGTNLLYKFDVTADSHEAVALKRFKLMITGNDANLALTTLKLYRDSTDITDKVLIYKEGAGNGSMEAAVDVIAGTGANSIYFVWDGTTEEVISAGQKATYSVYGIVSGAVATYTMSAYIADDTTALTTTTGIAAIGGYNAASGYIYDAAGTTVAANDIRITAGSKVVAANDNTTVLSDAANNVQLTYGLTTASDHNKTVIVTTDSSKKLTSITGTLETSLAGTCTAYTAVDGGGVAIAEAGAAANNTIRSIKCVPTTGTAKQVIFNVTGADAEGVTTITTTVTEGATGYTSGSVVASTDSDVDLVVDISTTHNLVWSDNSVTAHAVTSGSDWTNGYLVDSLSTSLYQLNF